MDIHLAVAVGVSLFNAEQVHIVHVVPHGAGVDHIPRGKEHGGDVLHAGAAFAYVDGVLVAEVLPRALLRREVAHSEADRELEHDDGVGAEAAEHVGDRGVEPVEDRGHADNRAGADNDAEHGQEGAHLVRADGLQGEQDTVREGESSHCLTLHPQGFDGVELGGAARRVDAEKQADGAG